MIAMKSEIMIIIPTILGLLIFNLSFLSGLSSSARLVGGQGDQHDGVEFTEFVCPELISISSGNRVTNETTHYVRISTSKSSNNYVFPVRLRINLSDPEGKSYFEPTTHVDFGAFSVTPRDQIIVNPKPFFYDARVMKVKFVIENRHYTLYPADNNSNLGQPLENSLCPKYPKILHVLQMFTLLDMLDNEIPLQTDQYTRNNPLLDKPYVIEGALFIDEFDLPNVPESVVKRIGEEVKVIFEALHAINLRFRLVAWYPYPKKLIINDTMVSNQRTLETYLTTLPDRHTFDVGMLLSSRVIERIKEGYIVGWANVGTMCKKNQSALVVWNKPTSVSWFLAHELVHLLNSYHDQEKECEKGTQLPDQPYIDSKKQVHWSNCTIKIIAEWIISGKLNCLLSRNNTRSKRNQLYF